jgi:uncharacterized protein Yka (UPF0111/DUF47 family)
VAKTRIIETLGEQGLLLPDQVQEALAANDRIKYYLTLLQATRTHAEHPLISMPDLIRTRESSGVTDVKFDDLVTGSRTVGQGVLFVPDAEALRQRLFDDLARMLDPLRTAADLSDDERRRYDAYAARLEAAKRRAPSWADNQIAVNAIDQLTATGDRDHDTLHQLVMDLHRELNRLQADLAPEIVDGARTSGLTDADRRLVRAFMAGLHATVSLKFDHPGLETTAARHADHLSIQNDLGTTEGHVIVIRICGLTTDVIYTDIHRKRLRFFQDRLREFGVDWTSSGVSIGADQEMVVGHLTADSEAALAQFLSFAGAQLVFLIDWNRARKQLERFVDAATATDLLHWAATERVGHRGFLQAGGAALVETAFQRFEPATVGYGVPLDQLIGAAAASEFLRAVMRIATHGLQQGHSHSLIEDRVEAELQRHVKTTHAQVIDVACEHAMFISAAAERFQRSLSMAGTAAAAGELTDAATLVKRWETHADEIVRLESRRPHRDHLRRLHDLLSHADDVADGIEEAAFLLTLVPERSRREVGLLVDIADLLEGATREYVRIVEYARTALGSRRRADFEAVLVGVERIHQLERVCDATERRTRAQLVSECADAKELVVLFEAIGSLERAMDALTRCALSLRDFILDPEATRT